MYALLTITKQPDKEPVSIDEIIAHLRLDQDDPTVLPGLITAARLKIEALTNLALAKAEYLWTLTEQPPSGGLSGGWCCCNASSSWGGPQQVELPRYPVQSIESVTATSQDGTDSQLSAGTDFVVHLKRRARLRLQSMPFEMGVAFTAGFDDGDCPETLRLMVKMLVAHFYEHRGDDAAEEYPKAFGYLLTDYRAPVW